MEYHSIVEDLKYEYKHIETICNLYDALFFMSKHYFS